MKEVTNIKQLEKIVHETFHEVADKYDIDVDLVGQIIEYYSKLMERQIVARIIVSEN